MKKELRVKKEQDFQKIISSQKRESNQSFVVYYSSNELDHPRFGISTPKKLGIAVLRVKIRRQVRAMVREILSDGNLKILDYVIIVRNGFVSRNYTQNKIQLTHLIEKIGGKACEKEN